MPRTEISSLRELIRQPWYQDANDPRCPHDAWIEGVLIQEIANKRGDQVRSISVEIRLFNAFHNGTITYSYGNVRSYSLSLLTVSSEGNRAHGDWLNDTFHCMREGLSQHQITFSSGAVVTILFETLSYKAEWETEAAL
jgi:hypothetical protein